MSQPSGQNQQNSKRAYCRLPPQSFRINFKDTNSHISMDSWGFTFSPEYFWIFLKPVHCTMVAKKFKIYGVKITRKCICESKNWICSFLLIPKQKSLLVSYHYHSRQEEISHFPHTFFVFFLSRKGGGLWSWKNDQN